MKKYDESLFQIGEVTRIVGITRKALLLYEELGLITPAIRDKESGYRYYTADNMTQMRSIRALQSFGLSLKEISEYYCDVNNINVHLNRMMELRAALDRNIQQLQIRAVKQGDLSVRTVILPRQVCFCRRYQCRDTAEAAVNLRNTYIAAARTGKMSILLKMFTVRIIPELTTPPPSIHHIPRSIPPFSAAFPWTTRTTDRSGRNSRKRRHCASITAVRTRAQSTQSASLLHI